MMMMMMMMMMMVMMMMMMMMTTTTTTTVAVVDSSYCQFPQYYKVSKSEKTVNCHCRKIPTIGIKV